MAPPGCTPSGDQTPHNSNSNPSPIIILVLLLRFLPLLRCTSGHAATLQAQPLWLPWVETSRGRALLVRIRIALLHEATHAAHHHLIVAVVVIVAVVLVVVVVVVVGGGGGGGGATGGGAVVVVVVAIVRVVVVVSSTTEWPASLCSCGRPSSVTSSSSSPSLCSDGGLASVGGAANSTLIQRQYPIGYMVAGSEHGWKISAMYELQRCMPFFPLAARRPRAFNSPTAVSSWSTPGQRRADRTSAATHPETPPPQDSQGAQTRANTKRRDTAGARVDPGSSPNITRNFAALEEAARCLRSVRRRQSAPQVIWPRRDRDGQWFWGRRGGYLVRPVRWYALWVRARAARAFSRLWPPFLPSVATYYAYIEIEIQKATRVSTPLQKAKSESRNAPARVAR